MATNKKHLGLIVASLMALFFNSQFAQAARKTVQVMRPAHAFTYKRVGQGFVKLNQVSTGPAVIKKTGVRIDRSNIYIGGYIVNASEREIKSLDVFPVFADPSLNSTELVKIMTHNEKSIAPHETRRFVIMRPVADVAQLLSHSIPLQDNCILNCRETASN